MKTFSLIQCALRVLVISTFALSFASQAALVGRDLDGNLSTIEGVYDDVLNITWLADANLAASNSFGVAGMLSDGRMTWSQAESYIAAMNANNSGAGYLGVNTWRQSTVAPVNGSSFNLNFTYDGSTDISYQLSAPVDTNNQSGQSAGFTGAELAYHYYNNLGGLGQCNGVGSSTYDCIISNNIYGIANATNTANLGLFSNVVRNNFWQNEYWAGRRLSSDPSNAFVFIFGLDGGYQAAHVEGASLYVWPVVDGDVGASVVPVPAAAWLFGSALLGLAGLKRKK